MDFLWFMIKLQFAKVTYDYLIVCVTYSVFHFLAKRLYWVHQGGSVLQEWDLKGTYIWKSDIFLSLPTLYYSEK